MFFVFAFASICPLHLESVSIDNDFSGKFVNGKVSKKQRCRLQSQLPAYLRSAETPTNCRTRNHPRGCITKESCVPDRPVSSNWACRHSDMPCSVKLLGSRGLQPGILTHLTHLKTAADGQIDGRGPTWYTTFPFDLFIPFHPTFFNFYRSFVSGLALLGSPWQSLTLRSNSLILSPSGSPTSARVRLAQNNDRLGT